MPYHFCLGASEGCNKLAWCSRRYLTWRDSIQFVFASINTVCYIPFHCWPPNVPFCEDQGFLSTKVSYVRGITHLSVTLLTSVCPRQHRLVVTISKVVFVFLVLAHVQDLEFCVWYGLVLKPWSSIMGPQDVAPPHACWSWRLAHSQFSPIGFPTIAITPFGNLAWWVCCIESSGSVFQLECMPFVLATNHGPFTFFETQLTLQRQ